MSTLKLSLREREIPGGWADQTVEFANGTWNVLLPADADEFLNQLDSQSSTEEPDVYWAKLWPPALTMANLISQSGWSADAAVLELGCGIGLVGLAALASGARVTFSDYVPIAVELALANALRNGFDDARGMVLDWNRPDEEQFDVILGSDILYDRNNHLPLVKVLESMLKPHGMAWIGDAGRFHVGEFIELAWARGFDVDLVDEADCPLREPTAGKFQLLKLRRC